MTNSYMTQGLKTLALLLCVAAFSACGDKDKDTGTAASSGASTAAGPRLTEPQVIGSVLAAMEALAVADSAAMGAIESPGVWRFAQVLRLDHRAIGAEVKAVADTMKVAGQKSPVGDRISAEATEMITALRDTTSGASDRAAGFVAGQIEVQKHLIGAMDSLLIPSSTTPALRQVLQDLRPAMVAHLQRAEQLKTILASASESAAPRQAAARISPDSARLPGDTAGGSGAPPRVDTVRPKPDTIIRTID